MSHVHELLHLIARWVHLIAGIMWIGNSMLFNWLDRNLERREGAGEGHIGDIWMVHSGGFYQVEKKHLAPSEMPATLHWFKWQNGVTWLSGIALLILVFYMGDAALLTDPSVSNLQGPSAIGVGVGCLVAAWVGYDLIWRSPLRKRPTAGFIASLGVILALSAVLFATLSGRAAYIHVGVMLGTIMTGNVWMVIIPSQRELVSATKEGRAQDPAYGLQAKERSVHNNYFTFPLLFIMLSGHFPQTYDHKLNWLVLLVLAVGSAVIRHAMNIRFTYRAWKVPATAALFVTCAATLFFFAHPNGLPRTRQPILSPPTAWADVAPIFQSRCEPCHATLPTNTAFPAAPNGVVLENEHLARRWRDKILQRVVILRNMPLANMTHMTDAERDRIGAWIDQGMPMSEQVFRSARVYTPGGPRPATVHVRDGRITRVSAHDDLSPGAPCVELGEVALIPGVVDTHVHINEPGRTAWEGFESATRAAAAGGTTTLVDMPLNSIPATSEAGLEQKAAVMEGRCHVDVGLWGGAVPENTRAGERALTKIFRRGALGFKCFLVPSGVDEFPYLREDDVRAALVQLHGTDAVFMVHAELPGPIDDAARSMAAELPPPDPRVYRNYVRSRPRAAEDEAIELLYRLCKEIRTPVHVVHLSSSGALGTLARARDEGIPLTAETAPHYLHFTAENVPDGATWYKCAPPIRERDNQERLWAALQDGLITMVVSDHSPCTPDLKRTDSGDFAAAWGGIAGLQFSFAAVWTEAHARGIPLERVLHWMCEAPARHAHLAGRKGAIVAGADADLVAFDPDATFTVTAPITHHRNKLSPYDGETLRGVVRETWVRGDRVWNGATHDAPIGRWVTHP